MKFYPKSTFEVLRKNEAAVLSARIARIRMMAFKETDQEKRTMLLRIADAYAQKELPLKEKPVDRQQKLFEEER